MAAKINWYRYGTKLRHSHPMYIRRQISPSTRTFLSSDVKSAPMHRRFGVSQSSSDKRKTRCVCKKGKGSLYSITERRVPELIPVLGSQPAGHVSHKPGGRLSLLSARPAVTPATLKRAATNFAQRHNECEQFCLRLLPDSVATAIWTRGPTAPESSTLTTRLPSHRGKVAVQ